MLHTLMRGSEEAVLESLTYILDNFEDIQDLLQPINGLFLDLHHYVRTQEVVDILDEITKEHSDKMDWRLKFDITTEAGRGAGLHVKNNLYVQRNFKEWLENENEPGLGNRMQGMSLVTLLAVIAFLGFIAN